MNDKRYHLDVPDIGSSEEIEVISWHCSEGDYFTHGMELCELVTEKSTFPLEAPFAGTIEKILCPKGSKVKVGEPLVTIIRE